MEETILDILAALRRNPKLGERELSAIIQRHGNVARVAGSPSARPVAKRQLAPFYLGVKREDPARWKSWGVTDELERSLMRLLRMKPRRTASGVATVTVLARPWPCSGACAFCPSDVRMPKSYLHDEPACQRAEQNYFDPYLQVSARMRALVQMGHPTDKVELIVLGGTWSDYPVAYQRWFVAELFRALNEAGPSGANEAEVARLVGLHRAAGESADAGELARRVACVQASVDTGETAYNEAVSRLYGRDVPDVPMERLYALQRQNEAATHRVVGLSFETRPDAVDVASLRLMRKLGATKVQVGVQSLRQDALDSCARGMSVAHVERAFRLLRIFGFKIHAHLMANLPGSTPALDAEDFRALVGDVRFEPDEVKLYPCVLIGGTALARSREALGWRPYGEGQLVALMARNLADAPAFVRVSRMIRDFSAADILEGNKKGNLRQLVDQRLRAEGVASREIRSREIALDDVDVDELGLVEVPYETVVSSERFLQWVDSAGRIAGFCRLSLPCAGAVRALGRAAPVAEGEAMIRELHVYGRAARLHESGDDAQHLGLGRRLVERACDVARAQGYRAVNVISSVGTRGYYRRLGFVDNGLYQRRELA